MFAKVKLKLRLMRVFVIFVYTNLLFRNGKAAKFALICLSLVALYGIINVYFAVLTDAPIFFPYAQILAVAVAVFALLVWGFFFPAVVYFLDLKTRPERIEALTDNLVKRGLVEEELVFTKEELIKKRVREKPEYYA